MKPGETVQNLWKERMAAIMRVDKDYALKMMAVRNQNIATKLKRTSAKKAEGKKVLGKSSVNKDLKKDRSRNEYQKTY